MPDFWSHHFGAEAIYKTCLMKYASNQKWPENYNAMYYLGAQGPDFFYYINKINPITKHHFKHYGNAIHESKIIPVFSHMLTYAKANPTDGVIAYVAGFITHYILDVHCHPLICKLGPNSDSHKRVEMDLDALCLTHYWHKNMAQLDLKPLKCSVNQLEKEFIPLWHYILETCFASEIPNYCLKRANRDFLMIQNLLIKDTLSKLPLKNLLSKIFHYDLTLLQFNPSASLETLEFSNYEKLYEAGLAASVTILHAFFEVIQNNQSIDDFIHNTVQFNYLGEVLSDV